MKHVLKPAQLRKTYQQKDLTGFKTMEHHHEAIIGQERAMRALKFGLGNRSPGFNVYISAPHGEEKIDVIKQFLHDLVGKDPLPHDWCYVNNFKDNYYPLFLRLPKGRSGEFKTKVENFIISSREALLKSLESEDFGDKQNEIHRDLTEKKQVLYDKIQAEANKANFVIKISPMEIVAVPLYNGKPLSQEQFNGLNKKDRKIIEDKQKAFQKILESTLRESKNMDKEARKRLVDLEQRVALFAIDDLLQEIIDDFTGIAGVQDYLQDMKQHILDDLPKFLNKNKKNASISLQSTQVANYYQVNVLVDNQKLEHAPIVVELNPTYNNLFGKIERESVMGTLVTDFTLIRPGALHHANGGYLILLVEDLLSAPFSYEHLKQSLRNKSIRIEDPTERYGFISAKSLKPQPVPLDVQVILIGRNYLMQLLYMYDDDFKDLFKVKAEFDSVMPATSANVKQFCNYVYGFCNQEKLIPPGNTALIKILEFSHRLARNQNKLSTKLEETADLIREASYYASESNDKKLNKDHILKAIQEKTYRSSLLQEKIKELIENQTIFIDFKGAKVGQVNGLSVLDIGDMMFGRPSRITASISVGRKGILDIEREAKMGGPIHTKGVMILTGFLHEQFGKDKPLNMSGQIVFEQSYGGIEGDSASSAELYAILSSLSDIPINQELAVTGSVNQKGEIQAVGGINEKIEGFFEVCQLVGMTGSQGVLIPKSNVQHLMLKEKVVDAVKNKFFHIYAIDTIQEGIELLTGKKAGKSFWDEKGRSLSFDKGSLFDRVNRRFNEMTSILQVLGKQD